MTHQTLLALSLACLLAGCASSRSILCVAPQGQFTPESGPELLSELNAQLPFTIPQKRFISKQKSSGLVGWAVVKNHDQKDIAKVNLKESSTLRLLQVEAMTPEFTELLKQNKN